MRKNVIMSLCFFMLICVCGCQPNNTILTNVLRDSFANADIGNFESTFSHSQMSSDMSVSSSTISTQSNVLSNNPICSTTISSESTGASGKRTVRLFAKNGTTIKVGDIVGIGAIHSPTNMTDVEVDYTISNESVVQFVYSEEDHKHKKYPAMCVIEALSPGKAEIRVHVTSKEGNCEDICTITVVK